MGATQTSQLDTAASPFPPWHSRYRMSFSRDIYPGFCMCLKGRQERFVYRRDRRLAGFSSQLCFQPVLVFLM